MRKLVLVFLLSLTACSPQSEDLTWAWTFSNGVSVQFPDTWRFANGVFDVLSLKDSEGYLHVSLGYYPNEEAIPQDEGFEESTIGDIVRLLRKEVPLETPIDGVNESVVYYAIYPGLELLSAVLPKTENIAERERLFREVVLSFEAPLGNRVAFWGGYAGLIAYPDDWELWNWNLANSPQFRSEEGSLSVWFYDEYKADVFFDFTENSSYEERALAIIAYPQSITQTEVDDALLQLREVGSISVVIYDNHQAAFSVDRMAWFYFVYHLDDDAVIFEMIQDIVETYHFSDIYPHMLSRELELTPESTEE